MELSKMLSINIKPTKPYLEGEFVYGALKDAAEEAESYVKERTGLNWG